MSYLLSHCLRKKRFNLAVWEFTLRCNSKCIHCGSNAGYSREDELNKEEALKLVRDLYFCGFKGVTLMGGEPFLRDDWYQIAKEIKKYKMQLSIVSNGLVISEYIKKMKKLDIDCICLSLDGGKPETHDHIRGISGAFEKTLKNIYALKKEGFPLSIITTINKINLKELDLIKNLIINRQIAWQIQISLPIGRFPRDLVISKEEYYAIALFIAINQKRYSNKQLPLIGAHCFGYYSHSLPYLGLAPWIGCQAGYSTIGIQSNGNIKGCLILPDDFAEGNIRNQDLNSILNKKKSFNYCRIFQRKYLEGYCLKCNKNDLCRGGCLGTRLSLNDYDNPYCLRAIEKKIFKFKQIPIIGRFLSPYKMKKLRWIANGI